MALLSERYLSGATRADVQRHDKIDLTIITAVEHYQKEKY